ncbi:MAG: DUF1800 family protein [Verrucomicrobiaceae bacterium]|nr:DUF1800 family protein [Verrucomicrobiaceae bacterium]
MTSKLKMLVRKQLIACFGMALACMVPTASATTDSYSTGPGEGAADGLDDVWQALFNCWGLAPSGDLDGDGCTNLVESVAGTDPRNPNDCISVGNVSLAGNTITFKFDAEAGKKYRVMSDDAPDGDFTTLVPLTLPAPGNEYVPAADNPNESVSVVKDAGTRKFYKLEVSDVDTDGDGVSNWAEISLGLNPSDDDSDNDGILDGAEVEADVSVEDTVSVTSAETLASEDGPTSGRFTVSRTRTLFPISVTFGLSGTAADPADYTASPSPASTLNFVVGETEKQIYVNPIQDASVEGTESVTATLTSAVNTTTTGDFEDPDIAVASATVIISNNTTASGTGLTARYYDHSSSTYAHAANFGDTASYNFTRGSPTTQGTIVVTPTSGVLATLLAALTPGSSQVKLTFTSGNLNNALYNHLMYPVTAKTASNFTVSITAAAALPTSGTGNSNFSIQPIHPAVIERTENINFDYVYGTPNAVSIAAAAGTTATNVPDNYSTTYEAYLAPATSGSYRFQLDADDKARLFIDLDLSGTFDPGEQVLEHGWDTSATGSPEDGVADNEVIGTFKVSSSYSLSIPGSPAQRYKMRIEHVETVDSARCRLQWSLNGGTFANIPQAEQFTHTQAMTANYNYTRNTTTTGTATITLTAHGLSVGNTATLAFSSGNLFTPNISDLNGYSGNYTVATVPTADTFTVAITGTNLPNSGTGAGFLENRSNSGTTGVFNKIYTNTTFSNTPGRIGVDAAVTTGNNGIWGYGTPDVALINTESFSVRWSGQVQPQFSEEYTFVVHVEDNAIFRFNGQVQELKAHTSADQAGATYVYDPVTGNTVVTFSGMVIKADNFVVGETVRVNPTSGNLNYGAGATYVYTPSTGDMVVDYTGVAALASGGFVVGEEVFLDPTSNKLTSLGSLPYIITAVSGSTFTVNVGANLFPTSTALDNGTISFSDTKNLVISAVTSTSFTVNHGIGKHVASSGNVSIEIINKPMRDWLGTTSAYGNERYVRIPVVGGTRYDIELEYFEATGYARSQLFWYSASQPRQVIPSERLYPSTGPLAPSTHTNSILASALAGGPFSYTIAGSNGASISVTGLPAWLSYSNGVISGTPPSGSAGSYQIVITLTNGNGTSTSVLNLEVQEAEGTVDREVWTGVAGTSISSIPTGTNPNLTTALTSLALPASSGDDYGTRVRGYITAPTTGNYYFWLNSADTAEFWLSNDAEPVNAFKRASITNGTAKSPWMALEQGQRYYFELLHKAGTGTADGASVSWSKPDEPTTAPSEIVPGYVLDSYAPPAPGTTPGTLYVATMLAQAGAITNGVGTATLRVNDTETIAYVSFDEAGFETPPYRGMTGEKTEWHVHADPFLTHSSMIIYDGDEPVTDGDGLITNPADPNYGSHKWTITGVGTLTTDDIRELIKQGKAYINLHTAAYPNGEIRGNYTLANGSRTFSAPPAAPSWTDDSTDNAAVSRFLTQASFGASADDIKALKAIVPTGGKTRYEMWIEDQFSKAPSQALPEVLAKEQSDANGGGQFTEDLFFNAWWRNSNTGSDQLRQRIAFALSEIVVVSAQGPLDNRAEALSYYYDKLNADAFGNFRTILEDVTLTPAMGRYLDMRNNDKPDLTVGRIPNENYAREIKQLFSIGLYRMWPDGTLMLTSTDRPIDTYTQREIVGFAHVFTGWTDGYDGAYRTAISAPTNWMRQMREVPARHFTGPKRVLNNEVLPGLDTLGGQPLDPYATHNSTHFGQAAYQNLPSQELDASHNQLFDHPNTGPFICRQLIQRLVTSHPSRDYLYRVVQAFNNDGTGVRGNMQAVIKAILLDYEARSTTERDKPAFGKQREAVLRVAAAGRAFRLPGTTGTWVQPSTTQPTAGAHVIEVNTGTMNPKLVGGRSVHIDFVGPAWTVGDTTPTDGIYTVLSTPAPTTTNPFKFYINGTGWGGISTTNGTSTEGIAGTYSAAAGATTATITWSGHWLPAGGSIYLDFSVPTGTAIPDGVYTALTSDSTNATAGTTFTITVPSDAAARSGRVRFTAFRGSYTVSNSGLPAPNERRITFDTTDRMTSRICDHHLVVGNQVFQNFTAGNPMPLDSTFTVESVPDANTFTVLTDAATAVPGGGNNDADNGMWMFPLVVQPTSRSGSMSGQPSTFAMGNTDTDMDQTPLNADTVFNYFLPDYKFPGTLASQGITTPEFQLTAETTSVRQANFIYNGLLNPGDTNGISSFKSGGHALVLDFSPWYVNANANVNTPGEVFGAGPQTGQAWTSNANLPTLINHLNTLLCSGQMSASARSLIETFLLYERTISAIPVSSPCAITTSTPHGLATGNSVTISGVTGGTFSATVNNTFTVTVTGANTFTVPVNCTSTSGLSLTNARVSYVPYTNAAPTDTNKRDRLRAIIHLILTSPDFTIQR